MKEILDIKSLIGEATAYDKKQMLEVKRPKNYMEVGSEIHIDMYDDRLEIYSPGGMLDGVKEFAKEPPKFAKEFVKASRQIYRLISQNPQISAAQMGWKMELSARQVQKYLKRLQELQKIARVGGRKIGEWKIIDEEYEGFFEWTN